MKQFSLAKKSIRKYRFKVENGSARWYNNFWLKTLSFYKYLKLV
jgi:hypothetical protein